MNTTIADFIRENGDYDGTNYVYHPNGDYKERLTGYTAIGFYVSDDDPNNVSVFVSNDNDTDQYFVGLSDIEDIDVFLLTEIGLVSDSKIFNIFDSYKRR